MNHSIRGVAGRVGTLGIALLLCCAGAAQEKSGKDAAPKPDHPRKHQAKLAWNPSSVPTGGPVRRYRIYRASATAKDGTVTCNEDWKSIGFTKDATPQYTDDKVRAGEAYCYAVSATNRAGESRRTEPVTAIIPYP